MASPRPGAAEAPRMGGIGLRRIRRRSPARFSGGTPTPVSRTSKRKHTPVAAFGRPHVDTHAALLGEFDGVADEIGEDLPQPHRIGQHQRRRVRRQRRHDLDALRMRARRQEFDDAFDDGARLDLVFFQRQRAGFDLGEVEDVFDQREKRHAGLLDRFDIGALLGNELRFQQQPRHAQHAVHRRADLVAHGGEEARFGAARRFGAVARFGQRFFERFALGDVAPDALHFDQTPASITQREIFPCDPAPAISRADELIVARACMARFRVLRNSQCARLSG